MAHSVVRNFYWHIQNLNEKPIFKFAIAKQLYDILLN